MEMDTSCPVRETSEHQLRATLPLRLLFENRPAQPRLNTAVQKVARQNELKDISSHDVPRSYVAIHSCWGLRDYLTARVAPESVVARAACDPERHKMLGHAARLVAIVRHHVELRKENQCLHVQTSGPQRVEDETYVYLF